MDWDVPVGNDLYALVLNPSVFEPFKKAGNLSRLHDPTLRVELLSIEGLIVKRCFV